MTTKMIPLAKMSKKEKKKKALEQRRDWNGVNPATRVVPSAKGYRRNPKHRNRIDE